MIATAFGQVVVSGKVMDEHSEEPMPFVAIRGQGTSKVIYSDIDGLYSITLNKGEADTIVAYILGYETKYVPVTDNPVQEINIHMSRADLNLSEVVIKPKENPANILMRKVLKNKDKNNYANIEKYSYETYNKLELDIYNFDKEKIEKNPFLKQFSFILNNIDSVSEKRPFLPLFLTETISDFYASNNPEKQREIIKASRLSGTDQESFAQFLGSMHQNVNVYDNWISLFEKSFVSPISNSGFAYYKYYLLDSAFIDNKWCYKLNFKPRRKFENTFFGDIWIADSSYALKQVSIEMTPEADLNFISRLSIYQNLLPVKDSIWMLQKDKIVIDFIPTKKSAGLIGRKTATYKNHKINDPATDSVLGISREIIVKNTVGEHPDEYWNKARHEKLSENEQNIYKMVDTLLTIPRFNSYLDIITLLATGYHDIWIFDIGPYFSMISNDQIEGYRFRFGGMTNEKFSKKIRFNGYGAYGLLDKAFKYSAGAEYIISRSPWQKVAIQYLKDFNLERGSLDELDEDNFVASALRKNILQKLLFMTEVRFNYLIQINQSLSSGVFFSNRQVTPFFDFSYNNGEVTKSSFTTSEAGIKLRLAAKEQFYTGTFDRISLGTKSPVIELRYVMGIKNVMNSEFSYHKIGLSIDDYTYLNPFGYLRFKLAAGKIFGTLPYLLLEVPQGNNTYYFNSKSFNNMNQYEFAADEYVQISASHHFEGFFLSRIPLLRRLKWRSLVQGKAFIGNLSTENKALIDQVNTIRYFNKTPYAEVGVGIENIFRILRFDAIWRLTHLKGNQITRFALYGSLQFKF